MNSLETGFQESLVCSITEMAETWEPDPHNHRHTRIVSEVTKHSRSSLIWRFVYWQVTTDSIFFHVLIGMYKSTFDIDDLLEEKLMTYQLLEHL